MKRARIDHAGNNVTVECSDLTNTAKFSAEKNRVDVNLKRFKAKTNTILPLKSKPPVHFEGRHKLADQDPDSDSFTSGQNTASRGWNREWNPTSNTSPD